MFRCLAKWLRPRLRGAVGCTCKDLSCHVADATAELQELKGKVQKLSADAERNAGEQRRLFEMLSKLINQVQLQIVTEQNALLCQVNALSRRLDNADQDVKEALVLATTMVHVWRDNARDISRRMELRFKNVPEEIPF